MDRANFKAPYKMTCKDKVIFNRLGYFQSLLKITPSLENSPKAQEVACHCKQKIESTISLQASGRITHVALPSVGPLKARAQIMMADDDDYFLPMIERENH
jgi:hypothetical protein